jgi:hypothetical protein
VHQAEEEEVKRRPHAAAEQQPVPALGRANLLASDHHAAAAVAPAPHPTAGGLPPLRVDYYPSCHHRGRASTSVVVVGGGGESVRDPPDAHDQMAAVAEEAMAAAPPEAGECNLPVGNQKAVEVLGHCLHGSRLVARLQWKKRKEQETKQRKKSLSIG